MTCWFFEASQNLGFLICKVRRVRPSSQGEMGHPWGTLFWHRYWTVMWSRGCCLETALVTWAPHQIPRLLPVPPQLSLRLLICEVGMTWGLL